MPLSVTAKEASLLKNDCASTCDYKRVKFQNVHPQVKSDMNPEDAPRLAGNVVIEPDDVGQQNDAPKQHKQPPIHAENRAGNDVQ